MRKSLRWGASSLVAIVGLCSFGPIYAQLSVPKEIANVGGTRTVLASSASTFRVGNGVLVRILEVEENFAMAYQVLAACNGSWVSDTLQLSVHLDKVRDLGTLETASKADDSPLPLLPLEFMTVTEAPAYSKAMLRHISELCKVAGKEPRNLVIPVSMGKVMDGVGTSVAILSGTAERSGSRVDLWIRFTETRQELVKLPDGTTVELKGVPRTRQVPTGEYSLEKQSIDCASRTVRTYEQALYKIGKATPEVQSVKREGPSQSAIPNSVGEDIVEAACRLYR
jgi:hypothetical protein